MKVKTQFGMVMIAVMVVGCGGGGDSNFSGGTSNQTPTNPISITGSNAVSVAGGTALLLDTASNTLDATSLVLGVQGKARKKHVNLVSLIREELLRVLQASNGQMLLPPNTVVATIPSNQIACDNVAGTIVVSFIDADNSFTFSQGDSATISYSACDLGTVHYEGAITMANFSITGDPIVDSNPWDISTTVSINNLAVTEDSVTNSINGGFTFTAQTNNNDTYTSSLTGTSLSNQYTGPMTDTLQNFVIDVSFTDSSGDYTLAANGTLSSSALTGAVSFSTPTALAGTDPNQPHSGVMKFVGDNSSVLVKPQGDATTVILDIDVDGNGSVDQTVNTTWAILAA